MQLNPNNNSNNNNNNDNYRATVLSTKEYENWRV